MTNKHLELTGVDIDFPTPNGPFKALSNVNLKIDRGEFVSLIGHSGCGKSTVLNIVAGLYQATKGGVLLDDKEVNEPGPERAVVFQNHSLLPWLTAYENVELAVKQVFKKSKSKAEMKEWIEHNLHLVHMDHAMHKRPDEISGGMKQRVGIARGIHHHRSGRIACAHSRKRHAAHSGHIDCVFHTAAETDQLFRITKTRYSKPLFV